MVVGLLIETVRVSVACWKSTSVMSGNVRRAAEDVSAGERRDDHELRAVARLPPASREGDQTPHRPEQRPRLGVPQRPAETGPHRGMLIRVRVKDDALRLSVEAILGWI